MLNVSDLQISHEYDFQHVRKGAFRGRVVSRCDGFVKIDLASAVKGRSTSWEAGELMDVRESFLTVVSEVL